MKSEKEIKELLKKIGGHELIKELDKKNFICYSDKAGHWLDCLDWVLKDTKKKKVKP